MMRDFLRLLQLAGLLGVGLSLLGLAISLYLRIKFVQKKPFGPMEDAQVFLSLLDAFREPGTTFLLSVIAFAVCEIGIRMIPPRERPKPPEPDIDPNDPRR